MKQKYIFFTIISLLFVCNNMNILSQKETYNWYFGDSAGVSFMPNGKNPHAISGSKMRQMEGSATISDRNGNVLFYSDGVYVWNGKHNFISNGGGLKGNYSSSRSAIIIPKPLSNRYYYIFTIDAIERAVVEKADTNGLRYSIIDALADNSNGAILSDKYNIKLLDGAVEKMITINHSNKIDVWLVTYNRKNNSFYTYLINKNGIAPPIITQLKNSNSTPNSNNSVEPINTLFNLDYDIKHKKLINCSRNNFSFELYDFDISTGKIDIENAMVVPAYDSTASDSGILYIPYSGILSNDGSKFYGTCYRQRILQFDLTSNNINKIINSRKIIADSLLGDGVFGAIRRGPDGKLYIASDMSQYLAVINKPDELGQDCEFIKHGVFLDGAKSRLGLPIMMDFTVPPCDFSGYAGGNKSICSGENLKIGSTSILDTDNLIFEWQPEIYLDNSKILNPNCKPFKTTTYVLKITDTSRACFDYDTITVHVIPAPAIEKSPNRTTCKNSSVIIGNEKNSDDYLYSWTPSTYLSDTNSKITYCKPEKNMVYYLTVTNTEGCSSYDTVKVTLEPLGDIKIIGEEYICEGDSTELKISGDIISCQWITGETSKSIVVKAPGVYSAEVVDNKGCVGDIFFEVKFFDNDAIEIIAPKTICAGNAAVLRLAGTYTNYLWSTGDTTETIEITNSGKYWVTVTNSNNCQASDTVEITEKIINFAAPQSVILNNTCTDYLIREKFTLENTGEDEILLSKIYLLNNNNNFLFENIDTATILRPQENRDFFIDFISSTVGAYFDTLQVEISEPCVATIKIPLIATAVNNTLAFSSEDFVITPGDNINIPIVLNLSLNSKNSYNEIQFDYSYNPTLLKIENIEKSSIIEKKTDLNNNKETLRISTFLENNSADSSNNNNNNNNNNSIINHIINLSATTFLGNDSSTELKIDNVSSDLPCLEFNYCVNRLTLSGCAIELRPIKFFEPTDFSVQQESYNIICEIKTEESGDMILELRDISGALLDSTSWTRNDIQPENKKVLFNTYNLSSGIYFIILISENNLISKKILLAK